MVKSCHVPEILYIQRERNILYFTFLEHNYDKYCKQEKDVYTFKIGVYIIKYMQRNIYTFFSEFS